MNNKTKDNSMINMNTLGERVKAAREKANLSQGDLAKQMGLTRQAISGIERNIAHAPRNMVKFAQVLKVPVAWLTFGDNISSQINTLPLSQGFVKKIPYFPFSELASYSTIDSFKQFLISGTIEYMSTFIDLSKVNENDFIYGTKLTKMVSLDCPTSSSIKFDENDFLIMDLEKTPKHKRVATSVKMLGHPSLQHPLANATTNRPRPSPSLALRPLRGLRTSSQMTLRRLKIF